MLTAPVLELILNEAESVPLNVYAVLPAIPLLASLEIVV